MLWVELMVHEACLFFPQLFSALVWCWETVMQSLWIPWEGEKRERSYTGVCHQWGFGDCQIQCLALSFIVLCENQRLPGTSVWWICLQLMRLQSAAHCKNICALRANSILPVYNIKQYIYHTISIVCEIVFNDNRFVWIKCDKQVFVYLSHGITLY